MARLGIRKYSILFPLIFSVASSVISEIIAYNIVHDPNAVGLYIIFVNVIAILYFSFRDSVQGGYIVTTISIAYYLYIIYARHYTGNQLSAAIETTGWLAILYLAIASIIGFLKKTLDVIFIKEQESRRIAEEGQAWLQTILQQLPVGVLLVDAKGHDLQGNRQLEKILGRKAHAYLEVSNYKSEKTTKNGKALASKEFPIVRALVRGETIRAEEMEYLRDGDKEVSLRVNAAPIRNKNRQIIAAVSTFYDITEEKELERRKDDFVNMASHELKTPITSMKLYIDLLISRIKESGDEHAMKTLGSIKKQTEKLQELVSDLLDVSRIQTGKLQFSKEEFELGDLIQETIDILGETTRKQTLEFKIKSPITVYADRFRIYQVLTNLITNAIKYSPAGSTITIDVKKMKDKALISVADQGIGIEKDQQKKIFERLYQVSDPYEKTFPGLGMGLYISKEIIRRHRGTIWVESQKGKGSTFYFTLPLKK